MIESNQDLPILDELGIEFEAMVAAAYTAEDEGAPAPGLAEDEAAPAAEPERRHGERRRIATTPSRRTRERRAQVSRVGRRAAILLLLVCLIGGVAFAALRGGDSGEHPAHTAPTQLGRAGDGAWSFSAYRDEGRLCTVFLPRGGELSGNCGAAPGAGRVRAGSAVADGRRYVFGVTGTGVARVSTSIDEEGLSRAAWRTGGGAAEAPTDRGAATAAGFPAGDGWFVLDLGPVKASAGSGAPAVVTPLDQRGHRAGPSYVDCSLGIIGPACKRRIEAAAAGH